MLIDQVFRVQSALSVINSSIPLQNVSFLAKLIQYLNVTHLTRLSIPLRTLQGAAHSFSHWCSLMELDLDIGYFVVIRYTASVH